MPWIQIPIKFACIIIPPQKLILPLQSKWPDKSIKLTYSPIGQECLLRQKSIFQIAGKAELGVLVDTLDKKNLFIFKTSSPADQLCILISAPGCIEQYRVKQNALALK